MGRDTGCLTTWVVLDSDWLAQGMEPSECQCIKMCSMYEDVLKLGDSFGNVLR